MNDETVPSSFPRAQLAAAVGGFQDKLLLRSVDGKLHARLTDEELYERYDACEDLAKQLINYCQRKAVEHPEWTCDEQLDRCVRGLTKKVNSGEWNKMPAEQEWIMQIHLFVHHRAPDGL